MKVGVWLPGERNGLSQYDYKVLFCCWVVGLNLGCARVGRSQGDKVGLSHRSGHFRGG